MALVEESLRLEQEPRSRESIIDFENLTTVREGILSTAAAYQRNDIPLFMPILHESLRGQLEDYKAGIMNGDLLEVTYEPALTAHSSAYDDLEATFGYMTEEHVSANTVMLPRTAIQAVQVMMGRVPEDRVEPTVWLKVKTGREKPSLTLQDGEIIKDDSQGRWVEFPLQRTSIRSFTIGAARS